MNKYSRDASAKKFHLLESIKDKSSDPKKVGFNIATNVGTSTGASWTGKTFVTEMKSMRKNQVHIHD